MTLVACRRPAVIILAIAVVCGYRGLLQTCCIRVCPGNDAAGNRETDHEHHKPGKRRPFRFVSRHTQPLLNLYIIGTVINIRDPEKKPGNFSSRMYQKTAGSPAGFRVPAGTRKATGSNDLSASARSTPASAPAKPCNLNVPPFLQKPAFGFLTARFRLRERPRSLRSLAHRDRF